jgi:GDP-D-mannose dehydratase
MDIIEKILDVSSRIVIFTSCELWSKSSGIISIDTPPNFDISNQYTISKLLLFNRIKELRKRDERYRKIVLIHPFYFNSVHRSNYFLFGKIFDSIIKEKQIEVGNLDFYRDMIHTKFMVEKCMDADKDLMMGSGKLFNVRDFISELYHIFDMPYSEYVKESMTVKPNDKFIRADVNWNYSYNDLLEDTIKDIENARKKYRSYIQLDI